MSTCQAIVVLLCIKLDIQNIPKRIIYICAMRANIQPKPNNTLYCTHIRRLHFSSSISSILLQLVVHRMYGMVWYVMNCNAFTDVFLALVGCCCFFHFINDQIKCVNTERCFICVPMCCWVDCNVRDGNGANDKGRSISTLFQCV